MCYPWMTSLHSALLLLSAHFSLLFFNPPTISPTLVNYAEVEIRSRSLFSRLRDALSSWDERRRRRSSLITPTPIDNRPATRSVGYGSLSEVPTEFHPTLPPPPARSFQPRASLDATARSPDNDQLSGGRGRSVRQQSDDRCDVRVCVSFVSPVCVRVRVSFV